jgi:hypothetical protein
VPASGKLEAITWKKDRWPLDRLWRFLWLAVISWTAGIALTIAANDLFGLPRPAAILAEAAAAFFLIRESRPRDSLALRLLVVAIVAAYLSVPFLFPFFLEPPWWRLGAAYLWSIPPLILLAAYVQVWIGTRALTLPFKPLDANARKALAALVEDDEQPRFLPHNHVAGLTVFRPGPLQTARWARTWLVLQVLNLFYRTTFVHGKLVTIPSIHFAQWNLVDRSHLLFLTNYDGASDRYLDDFFRSLALGVAFIWYPTTTFPKTLDPRHLKLWVHGGRTRAAARYRASVYAGLTVGAINNNTRLRRGLFEYQTRASARRWLRRFGTVPEEATVRQQFSDWRQIQTGTVR